MQRKIFHFFDHLGCILSYFEGGGGAAQSMKNVILFFLYFEPFPNGGLPENRNILQERVLIYIIKKVGISLRQG